jgi:hypothetical protein
MKRIFSAAILISVLILTGTGRLSSQTLWQIGKPDKSTGDLAFGPKQYRDIKADGFYIVGASDPAHDWPYAHPGPNDSWAGSKTHQYTVIFGILKTVATDTCRLRIDMADTHSSQAPELVISVNQWSGKFKLPVGGGDETINGDLSKGKPYSLTVSFPAEVLLTGDNILTINSISGSWFLYDAITLTGPATLKSIPIKESSKITNTMVVNALKGNPGAYQREVLLTYQYAGEPFEGDICINAIPVKKVSIHQGRNDLVCTIPEVEKETNISAGIMKKDKILTSEVVQVKPVRKLMVYILPHSHTDIGYTEIQTAIEDKQVNNLIQGIEYAEKTANYPEGARFVWNVEVAWAADLYLNRLDQKAKDKLLTALSKGQVAMNGMYLNELTGLCRPEELLRLFKYSVELGKITGQKVDAAMISDVPGYTWGTVEAMAQTGIRYFSVAPNFFDRIGDILVQWENKPFYWVSPSGKEKVLVWIPLKGYAMSHIVGKLTPEWVTDYTSQLEKMGYPYDVAHIRWSGHGDNAVPDPVICEFVKDWNTKYAWPKFKISSTSEAFSAFEKEYGSRLPEVKGDWTPYWEDGAGSSALETGMNRNTADRLSQAEALWALQKPATYPAARFEEAWKKVLLYSEHTWGAWCSITDPENKMTIEQWEIKKSYADDAAKLTDQLLYEAMSLGISQKESEWIEVLNSTGWEREEMIFISKELSLAGDVVRTLNGELLSSQRLSNGELAVAKVRVKPFGSTFIKVEKGKNTPSGSVSVEGNQISNNLIQCKLDPVNGNIISLVDKRTGKDLADISNGEGLNRYLYFEGNDLGTLQTNGPVNIKIRENGPLVSALEISSTAPGANSLVTEIWMVENADYVVIANVVDKKRAPMPTKIGDWFQAQNKNKESVNFAFPFKVPGGTMRLDLPLGQMIPWKDQIPSACKNWYTAGRWADVSNDSYGITWVTLDAPLVQVGELSARLIGSQSNPDVWRKEVKPTQTLYSWAMNNHWGTNYRQYQEGPVPFRYILRPHAGFDAALTTKFSTNFSQPLLIRKGAGIPEAGYEFTSEKVIILACKPTDDQNGIMMTLYNPTMTAAEFELKLSGGKKVFRCDTGENVLGEIPAKSRLDGQEVLTIRF